MFKTEAIVKLTLTLTFAVVALVHGAIVASDWPQWRGPNGTGVADGMPLPLTWSATENIAWKAPIAGLGVSAPIAVGDRVFVTSQIGAGTRRAGNHPTMVQGGDAVKEGERPLGTSRTSGTSGNAALTAASTTFLVEAFNRRDGRSQWTYRLAADDPLPPVHEKHNLASPSPVSDGERVYAWFGTGQLVALDMAGRPVWQRHLGKELGAFDVNWGHGSSPTLYGDLLILLCDHPPSSYLLALDTRTGKERWKVDRGKDRTSYSTPVVIEGPKGPELIVNSSERVDVFDPRTGAALWHVGGANRFPIPVASYHDGVIYLSRGYRSGPYLAVRPGGRGDVSASHVLWEVATGAPYVSSVVPYAGHLYMATDAGIATVAEASTGKKIWQERVGGVFTASPVAGDGKVYLLSESGETIVLKAGAAPAILARNQLGERIVASPAIAHGQLLIRTDDHLWCIREGK